jgi:C-terminal processing protease CtpA/Prc
MRIKKFDPKFVLLVLWLLVAAQVTGQQKISKLEQAQARSTLRQIKESLLKNYYDPKFHGFDLDARFMEADKKIDGVPSLVAGFSVIGWAIQGLNDSHTYFVPPLRNVDVYRGWQMEMVGDNCLVSAVEPESDAWKKGLRPGDQILRVAGYEPTRAAYPTIRYQLNVLLPQAEYDLVVAGPSQSAREIRTKSRMVTFSNAYFTGGDTQHQIRRLIEGDYLLTKTRTVELRDRVMVWKLPQFNLRQDEIERFVGSARKREALILDLRDNSGGGDESMRGMISNFLDRDVTVGEMIERTKTEPLHISARKKQAFEGKLFVLVNSASASAAEIFARTIQIEKRGTIIGDTTAGAVGRGQIYLLQQNGSSPFLYGMNITTARLRMSDGHDLEGTGVSPDVALVPTPGDVAAGRDPVLAAAAHLAGVEITPEEAGKLFPVIWATY